MSGIRPTTQHSRGVIANLLLLGAVTFCCSLAAMSQTLTTLYNFQGPPNDAEVPCAITPGPGGSVLGTSLWGGTSNLGTVFKIDDDEAIGVFLVVHEENEVGNPFP